MDWDAAGGAGERAVPRSWRRRGFVGVVRGAGRRGSACAVLCFYVCTDVLFLYFRCILAFFVFDKAGARFIKYLTIYRKIILSLS